MKKSNCLKLSVANWIAIIVVLVTVTGGFYTFLRDMKEDLTKRIGDVSNQVEDVNEKMDNHIQFHLEQGGCTPPKYANYKSGETNERQN